MTPLAQQTLRRAMAARQHTFAMGLAEAACFDLSQVGAIVSATMTELGRTHPDDPMAEHGGLLFAPSRFTWIEQRDGRLRQGAIIDAVEDQLAYIAINQAGDHISGFLELQPDGEHFVVRIDKRAFPNGYDQQTEELNGVMGHWVAAALLLINAPRGVERRPIPTHKGLQREVRHVLGPVKLQPAHVIRLSAKPSPPDPRDSEVDVAGESGRGKAFHFCRSHKRVLASGVTTRVRAHWKGDPSLGVSQGTYQLR